MRKLKVLVLAICSMFILLGCDIGMDTEISLSQVITKEAEVGKGDLYVEVSGCSDYQDSRIESKSLIQLKQQMLDIFKGSEFVECFQKEMKSLAHFKAPILFGNRVLDNQTTEKIEHSGVAILYSTKNNEIVVALTPELRSKLSKASKANYANFKLNTNFFIKNDLGKEYEFSTLSVYLDGKPYPNGKTIMKPDSGLKISLSNVSNDFLLSPEGGFALIAYGLGDVKK